MMHCLDSAIGNVTAALSQKNMWAKTLVVFSADNGGREDAQFGGNNWPRESSKSCATFAVFFLPVCGRGIACDRSSSNQPDEQHNCPSSLWAFSADEDVRLRTVRGMIFSAFEGGVRVASFVSGGALPASRRGKSADGLVHIADWYG